MLPDAEQEEAYFVFADGTTMIEAYNDYDQTYFRWKIPYSEIRDYVNEWTDNLKSDQEWRLDPHDSAYAFASGKWKDDSQYDPHGFEWRTAIYEAVKSRIPDDGTWNRDLEEPMTKAEIRSFLTGIPSWKLTKRAEEKKLVQCKGHKQKMDRWAQQIYTYVDDDGKRIPCGNMIDLNRIYIDENGKEWGPPHLNEDREDGYCDDCITHSVWAHTWALGRYAAESKKLPPVEKAIDTGIASGATMEGLDLALGAEGQEDWYGLKVIHREDGLFEVGDTSFGLSLFGPLAYLNRTLADMSEKEAKRLLKKHGIPYDKISLTEDEGHDPAERLWVISSDGECFKHDWSNDYVRDTVYDDDETGGVTFGQRCLYCDVERRGSLSGDVHWDMAAEEPSVYWWIKGALMEKMKDDREVTIDDVENIIVMVAANAPLNSIDKGMKEAEQLGDKNIWEMLKLAAIGRSEILTDDQIHSEKLRDFQAEEYTVADEDWAGRSCEDCYEEIKKGDLIHDDGYGILICKKCYSNYKIPCEHEACDERFKDKDEEREHRQETCNRCGGEGWVMTHYTPATYHDPADVDGEDC